jgi:hypothetical protein
VTDIFKQTARKWRRLWDQPSGDEAGVSDGVGVIEVGINGCDDARAFGFDPDTWHRAPGGLFVERRHQALLVSGVPVRRTDVDTVRG